MSYPARSPFFKKTNISAMFPTSKAIKNREKRTNCIQSRTIRRRRAGSWRSLRAHSTTSDVEDVSTPRVSQAVPMKPNYIIRIYQIASPNFEVLCSAFFQESAFPPTSIHQNILSMLLLSGVLFRLSCILRSLGVPASLRLLRRRILLQCARPIRRPLILWRLLPETR